MLPEFSGITPPPDKIFRIEKTKYVPKNSSKRTKRVKEIASGTDPYGIEPAKPLDSRKFQKAKLFEPQLGPTKNFSKGRNTAPFLRVVGYSSNQSNSSQSG